MLKTKELRACKYTNSKKKRIKQHEFRNKSSAVSVCDYAANHYNRTNQMTASAPMEIFLCVILEALLELDP